VVAVLAITVFLVVDWSTPGDPFFFPAYVFSLFAVLLVIVFVSVDYLFRVIARLILRVRHAAVEHDVQRKQRWRWIITPACAALIASLLFYSWPTWIRFKLSQHAFDQSVKDFNAGVAGTGPQWIGLYRVKAIRMLEPGYVYFETASCGFDDAGFIHKTSNLPPRHSELYLWDRLSGGWYSGELSW